MPDSVRNGLIYVDWRAGCPGIARKAEWANWISLGVCSRRPIELQLARITDGTQLMLSAELVRYGTHNDTAVLA